MSLHAGPTPGRPRRIFRACSGAELIVGRIWHQTFSGASAYSLKFYGGAPVRFWRRGREAPFDGVSYQLVNEGENYAFEAPRPHESHIAAAFFTPSDVAAAWASLTAGVGRQIDQLHGSTGLPEFSTVHHRARPALRPFLDGFASERDAAAVTPQRIDEVLAELLLLALEQETELRAVRARFSPLRRIQREEVIRRISLARSFIEANAGSDLSLEEMAGAASLSKFHFIRRFKVVCGCSPIEFQRRIRLERAADAIQVRARSLTEIALESGYADLSAFTRGFRRRFGVSPTVYGQMSNDGQARKPLL